MMEEPPKVPLQDREGVGNGEKRQDRDSNAQREHEPVTKKSSFNLVNPLSPILEEERSKTPPITAGARARVHWKRAAEKSLDQIQNGSIEQAAETGIDVSRESPERPLSLELENTPNKTQKHKSLFLREGDGHMVWKPKTPTPQLYNVVADLMKNRRRAKKAAEPETLATAEEKSLSERQRSLAFRIQATRRVLKVQNEELSKEDVQPSEQKQHISLRDASMRISEDLKRQKSAPAGKLQFTDIVSQYIENQHSQEEQSDEVETPLVHTPGLRPSPRQRQVNVRSADAPTVMSIDKWRQMCRQRRNLQRAKTDYNFRYIPPFQERRHAPVGRTTSDPEMAHVMGVTPLGTGTRQMDNSGISSERQPGMDERNQAKSTQQKIPLRRSQMRKQTQISESTDSLIGSADTRTREERFSDVVRDEPDSCGSPLQSEPPSHKPRSGVSIKGVGMNGSLPSTPTGFATATSSQQSTSSSGSNVKQSASAAQRKTRTLDTPSRPSSSSLQKKSDGSTTSAEEAATTSRPYQRRGSEPSLQAQSSTSSGRQRRRSMSPETTV